MRRLLIPLLMATAFTPVAAQGREDRLDKGSDTRSERSVHRAERSRSDRPAKVERNVVVDRSVRSDDPAPSGPPGRTERASNPQQPGNPNHQRLNERTNRVERPARPAPIERDVQTVQQGRTPSPEPAANGDQIERGGSGGGFTQANRGDRDHNGNHHWDRDWRHDHRYDWRGHRKHHHSLFRLGFYYDPYGWNYRRWSIGYSLWPSYYGSNYWLNDPWMYRLPPAYGPYRWIRYYNDALLVNIYTGQVVDVVYNFFW